MPHPYGEKRPVFIGVSARSRSRKVTNLERVLRICNQRAGTPGMEPGGKAAGHRALPDWPPVNGGPSYAIYCGAGA